MWSPHVLRSGESRVLGGSSGRPGWSQASQAWKTPCLSRSPSCSFPYLIFLAALQGRRLENIPLLYCWQDEAVLAPAPSLGTPGCQSACPPTCQCQGTQGREAAGLNPPSRSLSTTLCDHPSVYVSFSRGLHRGVTMSPGACRKRPKQTSSCLSKGIRSAQSWLWSEASNSAVCLVLSST